MAVSANRTTTSTPTPTDTQLRGLFATQLPTGCWDLLVDRRWQLLLADAVWSTPARGATSSAGQLLGPQPGALPRASHLPLRLLCSPLPGTARNSLVFTRMACLMFFSSTPLRLFLDTYHDPPLPVGCSVMHHQAHIYCKKVSVL